MRAKVLPNCGFCREVKVDRPGVYCEGCKAERRRMAALRRVSLRRFGKGEETPPHIEKRIAAYSEAASLGLPIPYSVISE
jgi:hypothetical protein